MRNWGGFARLLAISAVAVCGHAQALCPTGPCIYIGGYATNSLYVFDTSSQTIVATVTNLFPGTSFPAGVGPLHVAVAHTPNGDMVFVGMVNPTINTLYDLIAVVNASTGQKSFIVADGTVGDLTVSTDGSRVFAVERCPTGTCVLVVDTAAPTSVLRLPTDIPANGFPNGFGVALVPGDNTEFYLSSPKQGIVEHYDLSGSGQPIGTIDVSAYNIFHWGVAIASGGTRMYVRLSRSAVAVVDLTNGTLLSEIGVTDAGPADSLSSLRIVKSPDDSLVFLDDAEATSIHVISTVQGKELGSLQLPSQIWLGNLAFVVTPDGQSVWAMSEFVANTPPALYRFDMPSIQTGPNAPAETLANFLPLFACGDNDAECWMAMLPTAPPGGANSVAIAPVTLALHVNQSGQLTVGPLQSGDSVQWSASPSGVVTITALAGTATITAPASLTAQQAVTITATVTSATLGIRTATATVTLLPTVDIVVWPAPYVNPLSVGQTDFFYATATYSLNQNLAWTVNPSSAPVTLTVPYQSVGVTDEAHLTYAGPPPSSSAKIFVVATSVEDPTQSYSYPVTLCPFTLSTDNAPAPAAGGTGSVTLTDPSSCAWTAASNVTWAHVTSGASGSVTQPINFSVDPNPGPTARSGTLTIAGLTFTINQSVAMLSIAKSHTGSFIQGQMGATYTVTVSNGSGASPTYGTVTVTETVPAGLHLVSMTSTTTKWNCVSNSCSRGDPLNPGSSYEVITVTVNVDANAPSSVTNQVTVMGGTSPQASANDVTSIAGKCDVQKNGTINVVGVQTVINQVLNLSPPVNDIDGDGKVDPKDVVAELKASEGLGCVTP